MEDIGKSLSTEERGVLIALLKRLGNAQKSSCHGPVVQEESPRLG